MYFSRSVPFDKDELDAILKFGAEELFKSGDVEKGVAVGGGDKELQEMDIDDILSRAEMQTSSEISSHNDLLSQFKVASFMVDEDEFAEPIPATPTDGSFLLSPLEKEGTGEKRKKRMEKSWEELIPVDARRKIDEEEREKEQLNLFLPPRKRKIRVHISV